MGKNRSFLYYTIGIEGHEKSLEIKENIQNSIKLLEDNFENIYKKNNPKIYK